MRTNRLLSILLSISIVLSLAAFTVSAEGDMSWSELQAAIDSAETEVTINLGSDSINAQSDDSCLIVPKGTKVTLNLNGTYLSRYCYAGAKSDGNVFVVYGELVLTGSGMISGGYSDTYGGGIYVASGAKVTIYGDIELFNCRSTSDGGGIYVTAGGQLVLNNAQIDGNYVYGDHRGGSVYVENGASISVSGDTGITGYLVVDSNTTVNSGLYLEPGVMVNVGSFDGTRNISVSIDSSHDGIITNGVLSQQNYWRFSCDDEHGYKMILNSNNQAEMIERVYHNVNLLSAAHGTLSMLQYEVEVGYSATIYVTPEPGYCLTAVYETSESAGDSTPTDIQRTYRRTDRYTILEMPDRDIEIDTDWVPVEDTVIVKSANLDLSGRISLNIKFTVPAAIANDADAKVKVTYQGSSRLVSLSSLNREGDLYVVSNPCAVREFACPVAIQVIDGNGDVCPITKDSTKAICINEESKYEWVNGEYKRQGETLSTINEFTYSIESYKYAIKNGSNTSLQNLIHCLNNYAYYAWEYFRTTKGIDDHNFVCYLDSECFDPEHTQTPYGRSLASVTAESLAAYAPQYDANITGITAEGMYLTLESDTTINIHFTLADGFTKDDFTFSCKNHSLVVEQNGNSVIVKLNGINARQLDTTYTVTVSNGSDSMQVKCSALSYAYLALSAPDGSLSESVQTMLNDLVRSLKLYSDAANNYFGD